jgi:hypothetical protein
MFSHQPFTGWKTIMLALNEKIGAVIGFFPGHSVKKPARAGSCWGGWRYTTGFIAGTLERLPQTMSMRKPDRPVEKECD